MAAPTLDGAMEAYRKVKSTFTVFLTDIGLYRDQYFQHHWLSPVEEGDYQATLPLEAIVVDTAHALITASPPLLTIIPQGDGNRDEIQADKAEKWHLGVDWMNRQQEGGDPKDTGLFNGLNYGLGWLREVASFPPGWEDGEDLSEGALIFQQTAIHPQQVFFRRGRVPGGIRLLVYEADFTVQDIEGEWHTRLRLRQDTKGRFMPKDPEEKRRLVDYWEWQTDGPKQTLYHGVFIFDPPQFVKQPVPMDEYRRIPYYPVPCYQTGEEEPHRRYLSFLYKLRELPHLAEIAVSRELRMAEMYIDPILIVKNASGEEIPVLKQPGSVIEIGPEDSVQYLQYTGTAPDLPRVRELLLNLIHLSSFSPAMLLQGTSESAVARVADLEQGVFKISKPTAHLKQALEQIYWHRAQLAAAFSPDRAIPVFGEDSQGKGFSVALTGKQLLRHARVNVRIKPGLYSRLLEEINIVTQAVNSRMWSLESSMDFLGVQDKDQERRQIKRDMIEFSPEVMELEKQVYIKRLQKELADALGPEEGAAAGPPGAGPPGAGPPGAGPPGAGPPGAGPPGLPPSPFSQNGGSQGMQPFVQGVSNSLQNLATGNAQGVAANPSTPEQVLARRLQQQARGGRPVG